MQNIISKLNMLKTVHPGESWVLETRKRVLSEAPVFVTKELEYNSEHIYNKKSIFNLNNLFANKLAVAFSAFVFVLLGGFSAIYASQSSLPGEPLYAIKIANESVALAIASENEKGKIEIQQVGNRLEELAKVSQNVSDYQQEEKIVKLYEEIEVKNKKVDERLAKSNNNVQMAEKVSTAKVVNNQYEKYGEVLAKITKEMPDSMKEKVSPKANSALASTEKINFSSLMVIVKSNTLEDLISTSSNNNEIKDKLRKIIDKEKELVKSAEIIEKESTVEPVLPVVETNETETTLKTDELKNSSGEENNLNDDPVIVKETKEELLAGAEKSLENGDLAGAVKNIAAAKEIGENEEVNDTNKDNNIDKINTSIMPIPVFEDSGEADKEETGN